MTETVWVAELLISGRIAEKISRLHSPDDEVRDAIVCVERLPSTMIVDEVRGERVAIRVTIRREPYLIVLYPDPSHPLGDVWSLAPAYHDV